MRTKLFFGLTAGLLTVTQVSPAQNVVSTPVGAPPAAASVLALPNADPLSASVTSIPLADDSSGAMTGIPLADPSLDVASFVNPNDQNSSSDAALGASFNFLDATAPQPLTAADYQGGPVVVATPGENGKRQGSSDAGFGDWLVFSASDVPASLMAMTPGSVGASDAAPSEYAANPAMDNNGEALTRGEDRVGGTSHESGGRMPLLSSPEPGTISLFVMGGAAALGAWRRRK